MIGGRMTEQEEGSEGKCAIRQMVRMSRARRLFQRPNGEPPDRCLPMRLRPPPFLTRTLRLLTLRLTFRLTHAQAHARPCPSCRYSLKLRLTHTQTHSHSKPFTPRRTHNQTYEHSHTQTHSNSCSRALRCTPTQTHSHSDLRLSGI